MKIVVPMSGFGNRFVQAGYADPKPLIEVDGKPIIEHVVNLFPGETDFIFICNKTHLETTEMRSILNRIKPGCNIVPIEPHKLGPVHALTAAYEFISDEEEAIVNYCDFGTYWDYENFLKHTRERKADGAIPAYKGFHPHMLGSDNYAFMRDDNQWMLEIQEKKPFTENKMEEFASNGTYYFRTGKILKKYCSELIDRAVDLNGEYYVSCVFNLLIEDELKVSIYEIEHMLQWGTPKDLETYVQWSELFSKLVNEYPRAKVRTCYKGMKIIPMAGRGSRFADEGYKTPKPLIEINGEPMVVAATQSLPMTLFTTFVCLKEHIENNNLLDVLNEHQKTYSIVALDDVTNGQATTIYEGITKSDRCNLDEPLIIGTCDNGLVHNNKIDQDIDVFVYTFRNSEAVKNSPNMYSYIKTDSDDNAISVSMKQPISDKPESDHAIVGSFIFNKAKYFTENYLNIVKKGIMFNKEYYADLVIQECIDNGLNVKILEVDEYLCWGTPSDYETYKYWQSYFHKCTDHPYNIHKDLSVNKAHIDKILEDINSRKLNRI